MKIAISQIAWQVTEEQTIAQLLQKWGIRGVEIAPTKIWPSPLTATDSEISTYRQFWNRYGIDIVAMQALLLGQPNLKVFATRETRQETFKYLAKMIELAAKLGATYLVFGSPKNRSIGSLDTQVAWEIAVEFFYQLGAIAEQHQVIFCIEPNPTAYHCDFINTAQQGLELVKTVDCPGFGLHLDAAAMTLSQETVEFALQQALPHLCHFHISEPYLAPVANAALDHQRFGSALNQLNYQGWRSVTMGISHATDNRPVVTQALETAISCYKNQPE
jgi:sugar phosphate isomerase/epimerase